MIRTKKNKKKILQVENLKMKLSHGLQMKTQKIDKLIIIL